MVERRYAIGFSTCAFGPEWEMIPALDLLGSLGYEGVELELDRRRFHPYVHDAAMTRNVREALRRNRLRAAIGTGARYVLTDQRHHPGAVSETHEERARWIELVKTAIRLGLELDTPCVMLHSGYKPDAVADEVAWSSLVESIGELARFAEKEGGSLALEWHPEMFLRTGADYLRLAASVGSRALGCTLDVGHAHCTEDQSPGEVIRLFAAHTRHVQMEDMKDRVHKHLRLGHGTLDFQEMFQAFDQTEFTGMIALEFNAGEMAGDELARESIDFLRKIVPNVGGVR